MVRPMKRVFLILFFIAACDLYGDDQMRAVQQQLKDQGFFYGEVDGESGPETAAAIRRYQIRNGLEVTGALNPETLASLKAPGGTPVPATQPAQLPAQPAQPPEQPAPQSQEPNVSSEDRQFLRQTNPVTPAAPPDRYVGAVTPAPATQTVPAGFGAFYARTPYENAPEEVQVETLRRAQSSLFRYGYYRAPVDGQPGPETERSLLLFQQHAGLAPHRPPGHGYAGGVALAPGPRRLRSGPAVAVLSATAAGDLGSLAHGHRQFTARRGRKNVKSRGFLLCLCAFAAFGCATARKVEKPPQEAQQRPPQVIGTVALVNPALGFALVDVEGMEYPGVGVALESFAGGKQTAILMVSPEKNRPFIIADIVKGMPNKGDLVYQ